MTAPIAGGPGWRSLDAECARLLASLLSMSRRSGRGVAFLLWDSCLGLVLDLADVRHAARAEELLAGGRCVVELSNGARRWWLSSARG